MAISPDVMWNVARRIRDIYRQAELDMIESVARRVARHVTEEGWNEYKLGQVTELNEQIEAQLKSIERYTAEEIDTAVKKAYAAGMNSAEADFSVVRTAFSNIRVPASIQRLVAESVMNVRQGHLRILRSVDDTYRRIIAETATGVLSGVKTRKQASQEAMNRFADEGIKAFTDKSGRRWDMASYAEMSMRTTTGRAAVQGHVDRQTDLGRDLVIVSDHTDECPLCRPWEGKVLSISGRSAEYATLDSARGDGLFHPNCRHSITGYIPGLTRSYPVQSSPEGYEIVQQQRSNERNIRKWKRREAAALDPESRARAHAKVLEWQKEQRKFTTAHGLQRKYNRESIKRAH